MAPPKNHNRYHNRNMNLRFCPCVCCACLDVFGLFERCFCCVCVSAMDQLQTNKQNCTYSMHVPLETSNTIIVGMGMSMTGSVVCLPLEVFFNKEHPRRLTRDWQNGFLTEKPTNRARPRPSSNEMFPWYRIHSLNHRSITSSTVFDRL